MARSGSTIRLLANTNLQSIKFYENLLNYSTKTHVLQTLKKLIIFYALEILASLLVMISHLLLWHVILRKWVYSIHEIKWHKEISNINQWCKKNVMNNTISGYFNNLHWSKILKLFEKMLNWPLPEFKMNIILILVVSYSLL